LNQEGLLKRDEDLDDNKRMTRIKQVGGKQKRVLTFNLSDFDYL
jgi:hypothetical protein